MTNDEKAEKAEKAYCCGKKVIGRWKKITGDCLLCLWIFGSPIISALYIIGYYWEAGIVSEAVRFFIGLLNPQSTAAMFTYILSLISAIMVLIGDVLIGYFLIATIYNNGKRPAIIAIGCLALLLKRCN